MRRGMLLALFCLAIGAGGVFWAWKKIEPDLRYNRIHDLVVKYRGKPPGAWTQEHERKLWENLSWFSLQAPDELTRILVASVGAADPLEREVGIVLVDHLLSDVPHISKWLSSN